MPIQQVKVLKNYEYSDQDSDEEKAPTHYESDDSLEVQLPEDSSRPGSSQPTTDVEAAELDDFNYTDSEDERAKAIHPEESRGGGVKVTGVHW